MNDVELTLAAQINALSFVVRIHANGALFSICVTEKIPVLPKISLFPLRQH